LGSEVGDMLYASEMISGLVVGGSAGGDAIPAYKSKSVTFLLISSNERESRIDLMVFASRHGNGELVRSRIGKLAPRS